MLDQYLRLGHNHLLPNPSQLIIHTYPINTVESKNYIGYGDIPSGN
jgi:hypothetical protein